MANKDKMLVGFLVAAGFFSLSSAVKYVNQLSDNQKAVLCVAAVSGDVTVENDPRIENGNNKVA